MLHNRRPLLLAALTACTTVATVDRPPVADPDASDSAATESEGTTDSDTGDPLAHCLPRRTRDRVAGAPWVVANPGATATPPEEALYFHPRNGDRVHGAYTWDDPRNATIDNDTPEYLSSFVGLDGTQGSVSIAASLHLWRDVHSDDLWAIGRADGRQHAVDVRSGFVLVDSAGRTVPGGWWHDVALPIDVAICGASDGVGTPPSQQCPRLAVPVEGPVRDLQFWCAIRGDGSLVCRCDLPGDPASANRCDNHPWSLDLDAPGPWVELTTGVWAPLPTDPLCAIACDGSVDCWGPHAQVLESALSTTPVRELTLYNTFAWYIDIDGRVGCTAMVDEPNDALVQTCGHRPRGVGYSHLSWRGFGPELCVLDAAGSVRCWDRESSDIRPTLETGFVALSRGCALREDGTLACWGHGGLADTHPTREP